MFKVVLFDFDGTIGNSFDIVINVLSNLFHKLGYSLTRDEIVRDVRSLPLNELFKKYEVGFLKSFLIRYYIIFFYWLHSSHIGIFEEVRDVCDRLRQRDLRVGIVSSTPSFIIKRILKRSRCECFDFVRSGSWFGKEKVILKILKELNLSCSDVVYVGDEVRDKVMCDKIKVLCINVEGFNSYELLTRYNKLVVKRLGEVPNLLFLRN